MHPRIVRRTPTDYCLIQALLGKDGEETFGFDAAGAMREMVTPDARIVFERDVLGRVIAETVSVAGERDAVVTSQYDRSGYRIERETNFGHRVANSLDDHGEVVGMQAGPSRAIQHEALRRRGLPQLTAPELSFSFARDNLGQEIARRLPGGVAALWKRDRLGRPERREILTGAFPGQEAATLSRVGYQWRSADQIAALIDTQHGATHFEHDRRGHLVRATLPDQSVRYRSTDAVGNLYRFSDRGDRVYGKGGRLERVGATRLVHDGEGNLIEKHLADGAVWKYRWTDAGRLAAVTRPDGRTATYRYDALGRRVSKTFDGVHTEYVWDGDQLVHERRSVGDAREPMVTWVFEPDAQIPAAKIVGQRRFGVIADHAGTPTHLITEQGRLAWRGELDIWGELHETQVGIATEDATSNPWRYQGQYEDEETGLYYNRQRYYDPELGRYISEDPIGLLGGTALFGYVHDPLMWVDPEGLKKCNINKDTVDRLQAIRPDDIPGVIWHMHHIVMEVAHKRWKEAARRYVTDAQEILTRHGIDLQGDHNIGWAPNRGHSKKYAEKVYERLAEASGSGPATKTSTSKVKEALKAMADELYNFGYLK